MVNSRYGLEGKKIVNGILYHRYIEENYVTNDFYNYVNQIEDNASAKGNYAAWMSLMQHYGLPTRILDWSSSPLVACYFALEKNREESNDSCNYCKEKMYESVNILGISTSFIYPDMEHISRDIIKKYTK